MRICVQSYSICPRNVLKYIIGAQNAISKKSTFDPKPEFLAKLKNAMRQISKTFLKTRSNSTSNSEGMVSFRLPKNELKNNQLFQKKYFSPMLTLSPIIAL